MFLSHDAFIFLCELEALGNKASRPIVAEAAQARGIKDVDTVIDELLKANQVIEDKQVLIKACSEKLKSYNPKSSEYNRASDCKAILSTAVKSTHSNYQAVVAGKRPRWSAIHAYAGKLSRPDLPNYWHMIGEMTDAERVQFNNRVARLVNRGG